jgi:hypothetical protein
MPGLIFGILGVVGILAVVLSVLMVIRGRTSQLGPAMSAAALLFTGNAAIWLFATYMRRAARKDRADIEKIITASLESNEA